MFAAFYGFTWIVTAIIPDGTVLFGNADSTLFQLALFHSLFNVTNTLILMWFIPQIVSLAGRMVGTGGESADSLKFLSHGYQEVSDALIFEAKRYLEKLSGTVKRMTLRFVELLDDGKPDVKEYMSLQQQDEDETDELEEELSRFLSDLSEKELSIDHHQQLNEMIRLVAELERIGDEALSLIGLWKKLAKRSITLESDQKKELGSYFHTVMELMNLVFDTVIYRKQEWSQEHFSEVRQRCEKQQKKIEKGIRKRLKSGSHVRLELVYLDITHTLASIKTQLNEILHGGLEEYGTAE
jgi:phosphate:Na+ symporter